uniref:Uncharacterized protein n=1 Tax=Arundo donax TaxID=35708 RepID=A0A0A9A064_ARUDO
MAMCAGVETTKENHSRGLFRQYCNI